jgi:hypothetical protein
MKKINLLYIVTFLLLAACKPTIDEFTPSKGDADFTSYVAVGDSWTAGMADASLYKSGQENSFPNILATQFKTVGGGEFKQPLMVDDYGFGLGTGTALPKMVMGYKADCLGTMGLAPVLSNNGAVDPANFASVAANGPFNNISTPGMKSFYMAIPGMASLNPYYARFASGANNMVLNEIPLANGTFFTLWLGSYDVLSNAISGGVDPLTAVDNFKASMQATLATLTANGAKGAVANIPDVIDAPFFHTIPYNPLALDDATAAQLNAGYAQLNMLIKSLGSTDTIHFAAGQNSLVIVDASLAWGMRQATSSDLVLLSLPQDSLKCAGWGTMKPVPADYILDLNELANISQAINSYNLAIADMVSNTGTNLVLVDMYVMLDGLNDGYVFNNVTLNDTFVTGNFYSTDGLNPTPMGSALLASFFIDDINRAFNANIPQVIVSDFAGVILP